MNVVKFSRTIIACLFLLSFGLSNSFAQQTDNLNQVSKSNGQYQNEKSSRRDNFAKELNLSGKQMADLEKLKSDFQIEKGKHREKVNADRKNMVESHDRKLRSILDEKQYYAMKAKAKKMHGRKHGQKKGKRQHKRDIKND